MVKTPKSVPNGETDHILRPRPTKPINPTVLRTQSEEGSLKPDQGTNQYASGVSSGRSTPIPEDAPPSVHSISSARKEVRAQQKHRMFPTIDYAARVSHFDPRSEYRDFRGFFVLFWIGLAIMVLTTTLRNIKDTGYPLRHQMWDLMTAKTWQLALSDGAMVGSTALSLPLQRLFRSDKAWLRWNTVGMPLQSALQIGWLALWINWPFLLNWTWTAQVFFTLHTLVILMKMHSYAFYNGHLSNTEHRLFALDNPETASTAAAVRYPSSGTDLNEFDLTTEKKKDDDKNDSLTQLREDLALELISPLGRVTYPQNLKMANYADYILCPTLCYEMEYPRTEKTQWMELLWKTLAVFGCIFLLTIISEEFIVPVLNEAALRLQGISSWSEMGLILAESISLLLFPFMITFLLVFLVIFEYLLGAFAEITCFADRHFYSDWWNSCDWLEFSREWNIPVHHFLRRHVYGASRPYMSRNMSTLITFLVSALGHELVMGCITKKLRGYGFVAQMSQLPIVAIQRSKVIRSRELFNNVLFWCSMCLGLAMMCALYVLCPGAASGNALRNPSTPHPALRCEEKKAQDYTLPFAPSHLQTRFSIVAFSLLSETWALASSQLQPIYHRLPPSAQAHIASASESLQSLLPHQKVAAGTPSGLQEQVVSFLASDPYRNLLIALLGPLLILLYSMSSWWPSSGRYSPFASYTARGPPQVTQDDFSYLSGAGDDRHNHHDSHHHHAQPAHGRNDSHGFPSHNHAQARADALKDLDLDPDILVLKHKGTTYPLRFPAFSIAESLKVGDLRRKAAKETKCDDPRRVKLLYKGRSLRDDGKQCREEGLKQNSELMCVVSSDPAPGGDDGNESSDSASSAAMANGVDVVPREPRNKRKGHRGGGKRKTNTNSNNNGSRFGDSPRESVSGTSFLSPHTSTTSNNSTDRSPTRDHRSSTTSTVPAPAATTSAPSTPPVKKPTTPLEILDAVSTDFNTNFLPKVHHLLEHPPKEEKTRDYESKKLSEGILTQVLFKLDGVQTEDEGLKARRKECVKQANFWSGELDRMQKK